MFDDIYNLIDKRLVGIEKLEVISEVLNEKVSKKNLFVANKVIGYRKGRNKNYVVSLYKDLFYLLKDSYQMITLSDFADLHSDLVTENANKNVRKYYTKDYNELAKRVVSYTDGLVVPVEQLYDNDELGIFYANLEPLTAYGINTSLKRKDLINNLNLLNEYVMDICRENLIHNCYYKAKELKDEIVDTNEHNIDDVLENLRTSHGTELAFRYRYTHE